MVCQGCAIFNKKVYLSACIHIFLKGFKFFDLTVIFLSDEKKKMYYYYGGKEKKAGDVRREAEEGAIAPYMFRDIEREFDKLMERFQRDFGELWRTPRMWRHGRGMMPFRRGMMMPSVDLEDRGKDYRLTADLPDFKKEDIDIEVTDDAVTISAEKKTAEEEKTKNYIRRERMAQRFYRRIELPEKIDSNQAQANLNNGVLEITLPKKEPKERKKLPIT